MGITPINPVVEMLIGGVWTDITDDVRLGSAHSGGGLKITRGMPNEGNEVEPTQVDFVLNNAGGKYSPKNELSVNYGKLGRNTPVRFGLARRTDTFNGRTLADSWGRMDSWTDRENVTHLGDYWRIYGTATNFDTTANTGTIVGASGTQMAVFGQYGDCEVLTRVKASALTSEFGVVLRMRDSLVYSTDFESGPGSWTTTGTTTPFALTSAQVHSGSTAGSMTVSGSPANSHLRTEAIPGTLQVQPGRSYQARGWLRCTAAVSGSWVINWYDAGGSLISSSTTAIVFVANTWGVYEVSGVAPDTAVTALIGSSLSGSPANGTTLYIDDVEFLEADNLDYYSAGINPGSPDTEFLRKVAVYNGSSFISHTTGASILANQYYWIKAQITGIKRRMRMWKDGDPEPLNTWDITASETQAATQAGNPPRVGMVGLYVKDGSATVTFDSVQVTVWRAHAEITKLPPRWDLSRQDQWVPISARGPLRRYGQGKKPQASPATLYFDSYAATARAWLPLDEFEQGGRTVPNLIDNGAAPVARNLTIGTPEETGTAAAPGIFAFADFAENDSYLAVRARPGAAPGKWSNFCYMRVPDAPASDVLLYKVNSSGTAKTWKVWLQADRQARIEAYDAASTLLSSSTASFYNGSSELPFGAWMATNLYVFDSAGTVSWAFNYHYHGATGFYTINSTFAGSAGTCGGTDFQSSAVLVTAGHLQVAQAFIYPADLPFVTADFARASAGYNGEDALARWTRLALNSGIPTNKTAVFAATGKLLGVQAKGKTLELMGSAAAMDGSIQMEERDGFGLNLRTRDSLWNQVPIDLYIDLGHLTEPMEPDDDDQNTVNDVTVKRTNGGSARSVQYTGPLNVNEPAVDGQGVGTYDIAPEYPYFADDQLQSVADWKRSVGTLDELRMPSIHTQFHNEPWDDDPARMWALISCDTGDVLRIFNPEVSKEPTLQLIQKYEETIDQYEYDWTAVTQPASVYNIGVIGKTTRLGTEHATLASTFTSGTDTLLSSTINSPWAQWVLPAAEPKSFPFEVKVNGCRLRVRSVGRVLNANPYFDAGISGWDPVGTTTGLYWDRKIADMRTPNNPCLRATSGAAASDTGVTSSSASQTAVTPGETVRISAWIKAEVATNIVCQGIFFDAGSVFVAGVTPTLVAVGANVWTHFSADIVVPASSVFARVRAIAQLSTGKFAWIDDVRLMKPATYSSTPQTLQVDQAPVYGVLKTLASGSRVDVADPWRMAW